MIQLCALKLNLCDFALFSVEICHIGRMTQLKSKNNVSIHFIYFCLFFFYFNQIKCRSSPNNKINANLTFQIFIGICQFMMNVCFFTLSYVYFFACTSAATKIFVYKKWVWGIKSMHIRYIFRQIRSFSSSERKMSNTVAIAVYFFRTFFFSFYFTWSYVRVDLVADRCFIRTHHCKEFCRYILTAIFFFGYYVFEIESILYVNTSVYTPKQCLENLE